jgi:hypothetical protein
VIDQKASQDVSDKNGSDRKMGRYAKALIDPRYLKKIRAINNKVRDIHISLTLPWMDDGSRILSHAAYLKYCETMRTLKTELAEAVREFITPDPATGESTYDESVADAKVRLNGLWVASEYPPPAEIENRFRVDTSITGLPTGKDFRVALGAGETAKVRAQIEKETLDQVQVGMKTVYSRLKAVIEKAATRLREYVPATETDKEQNGFRDSLIENIAELVELVPILNVTNDPALNQFAERARAEITAYTADALKDSDKLRNKVAAAADDIISQMSAYIA